MTLTKRIIPCLDVDNYKVVKGLNFLSIKNVGDPILLAKKYRDGGADELIFLDITASREKRDIIKDLVLKIAKVIDIPFSVGGGISTLKHARDILLNGADKVALNTAAVENPYLINQLMKLFGRQCIIIAIDAKKNYNIKNKKNIFYDNSKKFWFEVFIYGGKKRTGLDAIDWAKKTQTVGAGEILLTSIDMDGTRNGYDIQLTKSIVDSVSIPVIASGGCGTPEHILKIFKKTNVSGALVASILHSNAYSIYEIKKFLNNNNIYVRL